MDKPIAFCGIIFNGTELRLIRDVVKRHGSSSRTEWATRVRIVAVAAQCRRSQGANAANFSNCSIVTGD